MPVSKKPRKKPRTPSPERLTTTPLRHVEIRVRMAYHHLFLGRNFAPGHFDHLATAQRLTCMLAVRDDEQEPMDDLSETLMELRTGFLTSGHFSVDSEQLNRMLAGICALECIWARYPRTHLESCYDQVLLELYTKTTKLIEKAEQRTQSPITT